MSKSKKTTKVEQKKSTRPTEEDSPKQKIDNPNVKILKEIFSDWTDEDLLSALNDYNGDLNLTISRISEGHATQWSTKKKNEKTKKAEPQQQSQQSKPLEEKPKTFSNGQKFGEGEKPLRNERFQGNNQGKPKFEQRKPREDVRKKEVTAADWSSTTSWDSQPSQPATSTTQPVTTTSSVAPWADKSKINQPVQPPVEPQQPQPTANVSLESEKSVFAQPVYTPPVQPQPQQPPQQIQQPQKVIEKAPEKPQETSRIPAPSTISKPIPQPQLPPPMTAPNAFKSSYSRPTQQEKPAVLEQNNPLPGTSLRFGTTGLSGEELPPVEATQRPIKKEEAQVKPQEQYQNPPGFGIGMGMNMGMNIPFGFPDSRDWQQQRGIFQPQPSVAEQSFKPQGTEGSVSASAPGAPVTQQQQQQQQQQQPMGGFPSFYLPFPYYPSVPMQSGGNKVLMYKPQQQPYYHMVQGVPTSASVPSGRPIVQPGMPSTYDSSSSSSTSSPSTTTAPSEFKPYNSFAAPGRPSQPQQPQFYYAGQNYSQGSMWP